MSKKKHLFLFLLSMLFALSSFTFSYAANQTNQTTDKLLTVHYLDVGQADSILIQLPNNETALIDAGNNDDSKFITEYLKKQNIKTIDYLIATHPHEDHIGSMDSIINTFDIGKIYMPRATTTTKTFEAMLLAIQKRGLQINTAKAGVSILSADGITFDIIAPINDKYDDLNNYSAVVKLIYGDTSFLFTGDVANISEKEILDNKTDLTADVLKVGHHGSGTSTSSEFLRAVTPRYAVISCGVGNDYGHPHKETIDKLSVAKIDTYRTDTNGTIIATSDGKEIIFAADKKSDAKTSPAQTTQPTASPKATSTPTPTVNKQSVTVYITNTGEKYHTSGCSYLSKSKIAIDLSKAKSQGYTPCSRCKPSA